VPLAAERIEVRAECGIPVCRPYFDKLLREIARRWPEASSEELNQFFAGVSSLSIEQSSRSQLDKNRTENEGTQAEKAAAEIAAEAGALERAYIRKHEESHVISAPRVPMGQ
jgi:hypothetical protein